MLEVELHELELKYESLRIFDAGRQARLVASLVSHGQRAPVFVVASEGRYVLIDGYRRVAALREAGRDTVRSMPLDLAEVDALLLHQQLDAGRGRSLLEEAWLLRELLERQGRSVRELAVELGRSASWVSRRLAVLRDLPSDVEEAIRAGRVSAYAATRYLAPLARANSEQCSLLVGRLGSEPVTTRQMKRLFVGWRAGSTEQRRRIVDNPHLYLQLDAEASRPAEPLPGEQEEQALLRKLAALAHLCRQVRGLVRERSQREKSIPLPAAVRYAFDEARGGFEALVQLMTEVP